MILSGHQPVYLPGIIVFSKIALSDAFMFVGHCAPGKKSWHVRNYIRGVNGPLCLTVPIVRGLTIDETKIAPGNWARKHVASIEHAYRKRPFFDLYFPKLRDLIMDDWTSLGLLNKCLMALLCEWLDIAMNNRPSLGVEGAKTDMLISMCELAHANEYLSSPGETYVDREKMAAAGIKHHFLEFTHPVYEQGHDDFLPNLSVIDLLFNVGPEAGQIVKGAGHVAG